MGAVYRIEHKYDKNTTTNHYKGVFDRGAFESLPEDTGLIGMPSANFDFYDLRDNVFGFLTARDIKKYITTGIKEFLAGIEQYNGCIRVYKVEPSRKDSVQCVFDPEDAQVLLECLTLEDMIKLVDDEVNYADY